MATINYEPKYNTIHCTHCVQYADTSSIGFKIFSFVKDTEEFNSEELKKTIEAFFCDKRKLSIEDILKSIRTIFQEYREINLDIYIFNGITTEIVKVFYEDGKLVRYEEKRVIKDEDVFITINNSQCQIDWKHSGLNLNYIKPISDIVPTLESMSQIKPYEIDNQDRILCTLFEKFYGKMPDFRNNEDVVRAQFLTFYFSLFNMCFLDEQQFSRCKENYPVDLGIYIQADKLMLFGDLSADISRVRFREEIKQNIERRKTAFFKLALEHNIDINNVESLKHIAAIAYIDQYSFMGREEKPQAYGVAAALDRKEVAKILSFYKKAIKENVQ